MIYLQNLLLKISEHRVEHWSEDSNQSGGGGGNVQVNRAIQMLAQKYCNDCKNTFEELSRVIQVKQEFTRDFCSLNRIDLLKW